MNHDRVMFLENSDRVLSVIRTIQSSEQPQDVIGALAPYIANFGFTQIFLGQLVNPANVPPGDIMFVSTWPTELMQRRQDSMALLHDPIALGALRSKRPFRWGEALQAPNLRGRRVVDLARDYGIKDGYMFPVHALDSVSGGVSLGGEALELSTGDVCEVEIVALSAYTRLEALLGPFPYQHAADLTPREAEVIQFAAAGKTNLDIATILGIQPDTVKKTLQRASLKLGTLNRAHTVATAIAKNLIFA